ncbi:hypothetical protein D3C84_917290 [compost metagenome]
MSGLGVEGEFAEDFLHQRLNAEQQRPARRKTTFREFDEIALQMHIRRFEPVTTRFEHVGRKRLAAVGQCVAGFFPGRRLIEIQRWPGQHFDGKTGVDQ